MAKWDLSKLPEGRKPLPDEWFAERAQMQERIKGLEELLWAAENDANEAEAYAGELEAKLAKAVGELEAIEQYGSDTLSGRVDGPDDRAWQRAGVLEMTIRARTTLAELTGGKDE